MSDGVKNKLGRGSGLCRKIITFVAQMYESVHTKESLLAHIRKMLDDKAKWMEYVEGKRSYESLKEEGIILEKLG